MSNGYQRVYNVAILDDIHNYFPALLYDQNHFLTVGDIFAYVNRQMDIQFNLFSRARREYTNSVYNFAQAYHPPPVVIPPQQRMAPQGPPSNRRGRMDMTTTTETIDITPLFTSYLNPPNRNANRTNLPNAQTGFLAEAILNMLNGTGAMDPVVVRPTQEQIDAGTQLQQAGATDEENVCPVCQERYTEGQALRRITHCSHTFHKACIDEWLNQNVHCPVCRHDIRESSQGQQSS